MVLTVPYRSHHFSAASEHLQNDREIAQTKNEFLYDFSDDVQTHMGKQFE